MIFEGIDPAEREQTVERVRRLIWAYFWLIFAEGILRKWVVPGFSAPLAIVRDPVLILAYFLAARAGVFPWSGFTISLTLIGVASLAVGLLPETNTFTVALYGFRTNFLHLYLIFLMPQVLRWSDVEQMGKWCVILLPFSAALMVWQFNSPRAAWINATTGLGGEQLAGTVGNIRPPSIFPFITGVAEYVTLATAFILAGAISIIKIPRQWILAGFIGVLISVAVSISRYTLLGVGLVFVAFLLFTLTRRNMASFLVMLVLAGSLLFLVLIQMGFIQKSLDAFTERVTLASDNEGGTGGFIARFLTNFTHPIDNWLNSSWCGLGLGMGTNAGALLLKGSLSELIVENELSRVILESGLIMGPLFVIWRFVLFGFLVSQSLRVFQHGQPLAWLLLPIAGQLILIGQLGRPTTLSFMVLSAGLCLTVVRCTDEALRSDMEPPREVPASV